MPTSPIATNLKMTSPDSRLGNWVISSAKSTSGVEFAGNEEHAVVATATTPNPLKRNIRRFNQVSSQKLPLF